MSLFKRSVVAEILSHAGVIFSSLIVIWLSVLLVRLLGQAAAGTIGADIVVGITAFSSITALPIILIVSLFIAILTTISRNYRESEMVVWFASGVSLYDWIRPVLRVAIPVAILIAVLTTVSSPWAYRQIEEYRQRYEQRSDFSKIAMGQFIETNAGRRVFFIEPSENSEHEMGKVFARVTEDPEWFSILMADHANFRTDGEKGERYIDLGPGSRYDMSPKTAQFRVSKFDSGTMRIEDKTGGASEDVIRAKAQEQLKARPFEALIEDNNPKSDAQLMWRLSLPWAALNMALLAIPLGSVNPRLGRSGDIIIAALVGLLYMNLLNMMRGWIGSEKVSFLLGFLGINGVIFLLALFLFWYKSRVKAPKDKSKPVLAAN